MTNRCLVVGILADCCHVAGLLSSVALPKVSLSSQANGCRRVHWGLEGRLKARNTVTNAIACLLLSHVFDCLFKI